MLRLPPSSALFPYTTLFRSKSGLASRGMTLLETSDVKVDGRDAQLFRVSQAAQGIAFEKWVVIFGTANDSVFILASYPRSEEHTSELQSQSNLVCRLLLEKK